MKTSLWATVLIVAVTVVLALLQAGRIGTLREERSVLVDRAVSLGLTSEGTPAGKSDRSQGLGAQGSATGRDGSASREEARAFAEELLAFAVKMKEYEKKEEEPPAEVKRELMAFLQRFLDLEPAVIPHLIDEIRAAEGVDEETRRNIVSFSFMTLAQNAPEMALNLYTGAGDLIDKHRSEDVVETALLAWSRQDPEKALNWLELNKDTLPEDRLGDWRAGVVAGAFASNPALARIEARKLQPGEAEQVGRRVAAAISNPADQLALLRTLDDFDPTTGTSQSSEHRLGVGIVKGLGKNLSSREFSSVEAFLRDADFSAAERGILAKGILENAKDLQDTGDWITWMNENEDPKIREAGVLDLVSTWTKRDFRAAAVWIGEQPDGPLRQQSVYQFTRTVAPHEPASAAEWALTLPDSQERTQLLKDVHRFWKRQDQDAAAAFAAEHGL